MSTPITEKILSNNNLYTNTYLTDTINLTKSISIVNSKEAALYNEYAIQSYSTSIDYNDKTSWRYYKHLSGQYHQVDKPITLTSLDNGEVITLSRTSIELHRITRTELLKFNLYYKELVDRFPEQELLIKAIISTSTPIDIQSIIALEDYSIVSYNKNLIEENEDDLLQQLQYRILNYKNIFLIPYYSLSDNLFLTSQYHIFYTFIFKNILALRLKNAKTLRAHSYHILNYLSSHHYLDKYYHYLNKKQALFLYRNLLYLDNHSGRHDMFKLLIEKLFTERNISVVNYIHSQSNTLDVNNLTEYKFKQKLLNNSNFVYSYNDFTLEDIKNKEYNLAPSNTKELEYNLSNIDFKFKNSLFNSLLTKDLEAVIVDNTDTVKYKLIPTLIDYWGYLLKTNKINFLVTILDPVSNKELKLYTGDLFKLFTLTLYKLNQRELDYFPDYTVQRVYKSTLPDTNYLLSLCYKKYYWYKDTIDEIKHYIPSYTNTITSYQFQQYISYIYKNNIALWLFLNNLDDKDSNGQFELIIDRLHTSDTYSFNDETPVDFLKRIGLEDLYNYNEQSLSTLSFSILNNLYDNKLSFLNKYKYIQQALIDVFKKFNSYTIQIIDTYKTTSPILSGNKDNRVTISEDKLIKSYLFNNYLLNVDMDYKIKKHHDVEQNVDTNASYSYFNKTNIPITNFTTTEYKQINKVFINFKTKILNNLGNNDWIINQSSDSDLEFLAINN